MNPVSRVTAVAAALAVAVASSLAVADDGEVSTAAKADFDKRMFAAEPAPTKSTYACFVRRYEPDHLARHPHQKVTAMKLLVTSEYFEEDKSLQRHFRLGVRFRDKRGEFDSSGGCSHARFEEANNEIRLGCGVDCDGGGIDIAMGKEDKSVIVRVERVRIWRNNKPDEDASGELVAGKDDAIFRLDRAGIDECQSLVTDRKELAAMRSVSNRK